VEVVASLSQGRTAAAQCGLFTHKSVPVIFEPPCTHSCALSSKARIEPHPETFRILASTRDDTMLQRSTRFGKSLRTRL